MPKSPDVHLTFDQVQARVNATAEANHHAEWGRDIALANQLSDLVAGTEGHLAACVRDLIRPFTR